LHFTLHCFGHLGPIFVQKRCCWCIFNHFVTLQSSEDRTHKQHVSIEGILEGVPVLSGYTTMVGLYPNLWRSWNVVVVLPPQLHPLLYVFRNHVVVAAVATRVVNVAARRVSRRGALRWYALRKCRPERLTIVFHHLRRLIGNSGSNRATMPEYIYSMYNQFPEN